jgi:asparagine synthase (glutamine-hydrolysing)
VYLSGGIDSTTVCSIASELLDHQINTYTVRIADPTYDEADIAKATAALLGTRHHEMTLTPAALLDGVQRVLSSMDEPLADLGLLAVSEVAAFAAQHVKVILSGDGSDEFFYGYEPFLKWGFSEALERMPKPLVEGLLKPAIAPLAAQYGYMGAFYKAAIFLRGHRRPPALRNVAWSGAYLPSELSELLVDGGDIAGEAITNENLYGELLSLHRRCSNLSPLDRLGREFQNTYLPGLICAHSDKATMMVSIEGRSPFLDNDVMRLAGALPASWKVRNGSGKWILRRYLERRMPQSPVPRLKKRGYTVPMAAWLRGELKTFASELLDPERLRAGGLFRPSTVARLFKEHLDGRANHYKKLWPIMVFTSWTERELRTA